jgi:carbon starvation protein
MYESLIVMLSGIIVYGIVYQFYVKWFDKNVIQTDPSRPTPAHTYMDGVEFFPSNKYVMLGWHWKSIAALGPVTGPALAIVWGWLPGFLWIVIGNSLMGWLHDYNAMASSMRNEGASLGPMTYQIVGPRARTVLVWFLVFYTILVLAAFIGALAPVLINNSKGVYTFGGPAAMVSFMAMAAIGIGSGFAVFKAKVNVVAVTAISLVLLTASVYLIQVVAGPSINTAFYNAVPDLTSEQDIMIITMLAFSLIGAIVPLWAFAMPINYLGFYVAYFVIAAILGSSVFVPQTFSQPALTSLFASLTIGGLSTSATTFSFPLWPLMFVTIACGACSGWHGLIGSSLSSKQLDNEADAHFVGGGSMLLEGILGLTAVVAVATLPSSKIFSSTGTIAALGTYVRGGAVYLGNLGLSSSVAIGMMSLMVLVLGLTLTQLALRFARLAVSDVSGIRAFKNIYVTSAIVAVVTYLLTSYRVNPAGLWGFIWVLFGGSNQLLAGVTFLVTSLWLIKIHRPSLFTGIPTIFMLGTTIPALAYTAYATFSIGVSHSGSLSYGSYAAGIIALILTTLGLIMAYDGYRAYRGLKMGAVPSSTMATPTRATAPSVDAAKKLDPRDG